MAGDVITPDYQNGLLNEYQFYDFAEAEKNLMESFYNIPAPPAEYKPAADAPPFPEKPPAWHISAMWVWRNRRLPKYEADYAAWLQKKHGKFPEPPLFVPLDKPKFTEDKSLKEIIADTMEMFKPMYDNKHSYWAAESPESTYKIIWSTPSITHTTSTIAPMKIEGT